MVNFDDVLGDRPLNARGRFIVADITGPVARDFTRPPASPSRQSQPMASEALPARRTTHPDRAVGGAEETTFIN